MNANLPIEILTRLGPDRYQSVNKAYNQILSTWLKKMKTLPNSEGHMTFCMRATTGTAILEGKSHPVAILDVALRKLDTSMSTGMFAQADIFLKDAAVEVMEKDKSLNDLAIRYFPSIYT